MPHRVSLTRKTPHVAIVDSDDDNREMVAALLVHAGYVVSGCRLVDIQSGSVNWPEFVQKNTPDVVVWDVPHPYQNTATFLRLLCTSSTVQGIPFVITTTHAKNVENILADCPMEHVVGIISKPGPSLSLINMVEEAFAKRRGWTMASVPEEKELAIAE